MIEAHIADGDFVGDPTADHRPQRRHRRGPGRGERASPSSASSRSRTGSASSRPMPEYPPQFYDDVRIQGKLIGVIRRLD